MDAVLLTLPLPHPQTLSHSLKMADQNLEKLKTESERLEQHTQKSVNWLLWAMLIVVTTMRPSAMPAAGPTAQLSPELSTWQQHHTAYMKTSALRTPLESPNCYQ